jgi:hypothetical protein
VTENIGRTQKERKYCKGWKGKLLRKIEELSKNVGGRPT